MHLCLNSIVKNEGVRIERMLASVAPWIDSWVIVDTGSTDDTKQKIVDFFKARRIPGEIRDEPFIDWSQARNAALEWARKFSFAYDPDYFLLCDADMELIVKDPARFMEQRNGPAYNMYQVAGGCHYQNCRLVNSKVTGGYRGSTHEYIDIPSGGVIGEDIAYFIDHADGANRPDKFKRDIRLLLADLKKDPKNERAMFYLAQSYRDAGNHERAAKWYKRRVEAGGWDEEVWQAQVFYAHCLKGLKDEAGFIRETLVAYNMRPTRAEPMYDLAKFYREKNMNAPALMVAEAVVSLPLSKDALFVNNFVYEVGLKEEVSISAFYVPGKKRIGYKATSDLMMNKGPFDWVKHGARENIIHYLEPLSAFCPSFKWEKIPFDPPENWIAMNPSITIHNGTPVVNVRCVNYRIDEEGRYLIRGMDGTANGDNPINTRNFILTKVHSEWLGAQEVFAPSDMPCEWPLVIGFEDMRLISWKDELYASSTVRQLHADGNCEQVLTRIEDCDDGFIHTGMKRMLRQPRSTEKNWAPVVLKTNGPELYFVWRPGEVVNTDGVTVRKHDLGIASDNISGSSQLIEFWRGNTYGWLAITHEARHFQGKGTRYYIHRFVWYSSDFSSAVFSLPFFFHDKQIEFVGGMCLAPKGLDLMISYGYRDEEARIATVSVEEVGKFLWG